MLFILPALKCAVGGCSAVGEGADKDLGVCVDLSIPKEVFYHTTRHFLITTHSGVYFTTILLFVGERSLSGSSPSGSKHKQIFLK